MNLTGSHQPEPYRQNWVEILSSRQNNKYLLPKVFGVNTAIIPNVFFLLKSTYQYVCVCAYVCVCMCICAWMYVRMCIHSCFSCVQLSVTLWTVAHQAPPSMGFSRQEYQSGLPCPPPGDLPDQGIEPTIYVTSWTAGRFFIHWATWEVYVCVYTHIHIPILRSTFYISALRIIFLKLYTFSTKWVMNCCAAYFSRTQ